MNDNINEKEQQQIPGQMELKHPGFILQSDPTKEEVKKRQSEMKTQGRKGCAQKRINMAFTPENYEFIRVMSKVTGKTMTQFANLIMSAYRKEHPEIAKLAENMINAANEEMSDILKADDF